MPSLAVVADFFSVSFFVVRLFVLFFGQCAVETRPLLLFPLPPTQHPDGLPLFIVDGAADMTHAAPDQPRAVPACRLGCCRAVPLYALGTVGHGHLPAEDLL